MTDYSRFPYTHLPIANHPSWGRCVGFGGIGSGLPKGTDATKKRMGELRAMRKVGVFTKGSPAAKAYMAKLRAMRGKKKTPNKRWI